MDDSSHALPPPATLEPISRPSSTSTQASLAQLPGISAFAAGADASGKHSPHTKPAASATSAAFIHSSPGATLTGGANGNLPICQNCATSTTPLWRRDEMGSVLCNACGLFLKLHGRPRPISLKTDVIKSRNRVKTSMRPDVAIKRKNAAVAAAAAAAAAAASVANDPNAVVDLQSQAYAATAALSARQSSQKSANGHIDGHDSPMSGAGTSNLYNAHASASYPMLDDGHYHGQHLQPFGASGTLADRAGSPVNGERLDMGQSQEQLLAANSSLKTRVAELEVINDFIQRRLGHFEPPYGAPQDGSDAGQQASETQLRSQVELLTQSEVQLRSQLEESYRRENMLKRRLDELEQELKEVKDAVGGGGGSGGGGGGDGGDEQGPSKKPRLESPVAATDAEALSVIVANMEAEANAAKQQDDAATKPTEAESVNIEAAPAHEDAAVAAAESAEVSAGHDAGEDATKEVPPREEEGSAEATTAAAAAVAAAAAAAADFKSEAEKENAEEAPVATTTAETLSSPKP